MSENHNNSADAAATAAQSSSSEPQQVNQTGSSSAAASKGPEKTISCVSCRRRKLKCDRIKPKCGTCTRLRHDCEFPERRRNLGSKRRNMRELEERLAQVEGKLVAEQNMPGNTYSLTRSLEPEWDIIPDDMDMALGNGGILDESLNMQHSEFGYNAPSVPVADHFSQELISLGLDEPLPPQDVIDDLHAIYFSTFHKFIPMIHKPRFFASLARAPHMRPPVCLLYAMWTISATMADKYSCYEDVFYQRARKYVEAAEMKGHGETFVSLYHAQTWALIANYEAKKTYFSRAWMSTGRFSRMIHMLGLHRVDGDDRDLKRILPPPRDWIDLEERRRTFWAAFYGDRWASSGTGWPMTINEEEISTNLPASEESFETGTEQSSISLKTALAAQGASNISPFGGVILSAALYGHNFSHLHRSSENENPADISNGDYWKRHRKMDNVLSNVFMFLPDHLRLPYGLRDMNVVFLHMNIHASSICLHQAAVITAEKHKTGSSIIRQSRARSLMAAEEISNLMRLVTHVDPSNLNPWMGFCLYLAGGVFVQSNKTESPHPQSGTNLEFILAAMKALSKRHPLTKHFVAQLELDASALGIPLSGFQGVHIDSPHELSTGFPNIPMNGLLAERKGAPMTVTEIQSFVQQERIAPPWTPRQGAWTPRSEAALHGVMLATKGTDQSDSNRVFVDPFSREEHKDPHDFTSNAIPPMADTQSRDLSPMANSDSVPTTLSGNTPSSDYSGSNSKQFPYRPSEPDAHKKSSVAQETGIFSTTIHDWTLTQDELNEFENQQAIADSNVFLDDAIWNPDLNHV